MEANDDGLIRVMPDTLANKIAAGEVVQRPASVAKELLENAVDAGAASIELLLKDAGSTLVQVIDDGCGMSAEDAVRCFERHATSKIRGIDDLERLRTLGFRGEALASIAAVAQVELKTKRAGDAVGTRVVVEGGETVTVEPCATPPGTNLAVRNLFFNVPARRNFLKTAATELKHLTETFQFIALPQPTVGFRCVHNGHVHYDLPAASGDRLDALRRRILDLFGDRHEGRLLPVEDEGGGLRVHGFIGAPGAGRKTRGEQFLFVNDRYVRDRYLSHAVRTGYGDLLPDGAFPFFALFLEADPRRVDVNVHPTKAEVKFDDEGGFYSFLRHAVRQTLRRAQQTPAFDAAASDEAASEDGAPKGDEATSATRRPRPFVPRGLDLGGPSGGPSGDASGAPSGDAGASGNDARPARPRPSGGASSGGGRTAARPASGGGRWMPPGAQSEALYGPRDATDAGATGGGEADAMEREDAVTGAAAGERPLWSLHGTYLLTPTDEGVMLIDQRAAHVRILYERALGRLERERGESQQLLFPHTFDLAPADVPLFDALAGDLRALGFEAERLSGRTVIVRGVPPDARTSDEQALLEELLEAYKTAPATAGGEAARTKRREHLARLAARQQAVPRGQTLAPAERRALVRDLFACAMPYADPTGTPTILRLSMEELAKRFGS